MLLINKCTSFKTIRIWSPFKSPLLSNYLRISWPKLISLSNKYFPKAATSKDKFQMASSTRTYNNLCSLCLRHRRRLFKGRIRMISLTKVLLREMFKLLTRIWLKWKSSWNFVAPHLPKTKYLYSNRSQLHLKLLLIKVKQKIKRQLSKRIL